MQKHNVFSGKNKEKTESLFVAEQLCHIALCRMFASDDFVKRSALFLYLLKNRCICRYQLYTLLSYDRYHCDSERNIYQFLVKRSGENLIRTEHDSSGNEMLDLIFPTLSGLRLGVDLFLDEIKTILSEDGYFTGACKMLLGENPERLSEFSDILLENRQKYPTYTSLLHSVSTRDSYIAFLRGLSGLSLSSVQFEVEYEDVHPVQGTHKGLRGGVRSDALIFLPVNGATNSFPIVSDNGSVPVCIEQDTAKQTKSVLQNKIAHYIDLLAAPRFERYGVPTVIVFSVLSNTQSVKQAKQKDASMQTRFIDDFIRIGKIVSHISGRPFEQFTLGELWDIFSALGSQDRLFQKYLDEIERCKDEYHRGLPVYKLKEYTKTILKQSGAVKEAFSETHESFLRRKRIVFSAAMELSGIRQMALNGYSVCAVSNHETNTLLSFFPALSSGALRFDGIFDTGSAAGTPQFVPLYRHETSSGTILFRNAYRLAGSTCIVENVADDCCGFLRIRELLLREASLSVKILILVPNVDFLEEVTRLKSLASPEQQKSIYLSIFVSDNNQKFFTTKPSLLCSITGI